MCFKSIFRRGFNSHHLHLIINHKSIRRSFFKKPDKKKFIRYNERIRILRVQVVDETGKSLGVLDTYKALQIARDKSLDLVEIAPTAKPPVCKIIDFGKYKYQQAKKDQKQKSKQKKTEIKGIRIGLSTSLHDLGHKVKHVEDFLNGGDKVRLEIKLRGREKAHQNLARERLNDFLKMVSVEYKIEEEPKRNPMGLIMTIAKI